MPVTGPNQAPPDADPNAGRRGWLERTGPHALLRTLRAGDPLIASITVRPGTLTNTLSAIQVRFHGEAGETVVAIPVFATYHRQWTLDLTAAVPAAALAGGSWQAQVLLTDAAGTHALPVRQAAAEAFSLASLPELDDTPWRLDHEPAGAGS